MKEVQKKYEEPVCRKPERVNINCADHRAALESAICDIPGFKDSVFAELQHSEFN